MLEEVVNGQENNMSILNPSFPKNENNYEFKPDQTVYVPYLKCGMFDIEVLCDVAYSTIPEAKRHFWFTNPGEDDEVWIEKMSVETFLKERGVNGMNPFESLNLLEFNLSYKEHYKDYESGEQYEVED